MIRVYTYIKFGRAQSPYSLTGKSLTFLYEYAIHVYSKEYIKKKMKGNIK